MKRIALALALVLSIALLGGGAYLAAWPVPIRAVAWNAPHFAGYAGAHAANDRLAGLQLIPLGSEAGPEHVAAGPDGRLYAAVASGKVLRMNADGSDPQVFADTGGRVLGFDFDAAGRLVAADAMKGLLAIGPDGRITLLADRVGDDPIRYANSVVVARSGKVYFSDASRRFAPAQWGGTFMAAVLDILEQSATSRVLEYDPATQAARVVARGLSFANGVALSEDGQWLFVAETGRYRIWKIATAAAGLDVAQGGGQAGADAGGQAHVLLHNLPGYPDNLMRGAQGRIWVGFTGPRSDRIDAMSAKPFLRELTLRLPRSLWPLPRRYGHVFAFDESGRVVADLQDPSGAYPQTTGVTETADRIYVQNLHLKVLGWKPLSALRAH
jgi:sugar lactone lactonase YvrE